jgi:hypothetical protein
MATQNDDFLEADEIIVMEIADGRPTAHSFVRAPGQHGPLRKICAHIIEDDQGVTIEFRADPHAPSGPSNELDRELSWFAFDWDDLERFSRMLQKCLTKRPK